MDDLTFLFLFLGIGLLLWMLVVVIWTRLRNKNGVPTTAVVVHKARAPGDTSHFVPVLRYNVNGRMNEIEHLAGRFFEDGEIIEIRYHKKNVNKLMGMGKKDKFDIWPLFVGIIALAIGLIRLLS